MEFTLGTTGAILAAAVTITSSSARPVQGTSLDILFTTAPLNGSHGPYTRANTVFPVYNPCLSASTNGPRDLRLAHQHQFVPVSYDA